MLTYEEYYNAHPAKEVERLSRSRQSEGNTRKNTSYEDYAKENVSKYIFENDTVEKAYKFWETNEDKLERLKRIWLDLKKKNAIGGLEARTLEEQNDLNS